MLDQKGFDLWADGYDASVGLSEEAGTYPFAGYRAVLNEIYNRVLSGPHRDVLDIGFGTAVLTTRLYAQGCHIFGQDFSARMIDTARRKMPGARLYQGDFALGLVPELAAHRYDAIIATYSLHHLSDSQKVRFLNSLLPLLKEDGCIYIGDVAFKTRADLEACKAKAGADWDDDEIYFVWDELKEHVPQMEFEQVSCCAGVLSVKNRPDL